MVILAHSKKRICNWYYSIMIRPCCFCPIKILSIKTTPKSINISLFIDCRSIFLSCRPDASGYFPVARHVCTCISWSAPLQYAQPEPIVPDRTIRANRAIRTNRSYIMLCVNVVSLKPSINEVFLLIFMSVASISIIITLPLISNQSSLLWCLFLCAKTHPSWTELTLKILLLPLPSHPPSKMFAIATPPKPCYPQYIQSTWGNRHDESASRRSSARFALSDLPKSQWCDIRTTYIEKNLTLSELADIYKCDARTIKFCLIRNKSSGAFGKNRRRHASTHSETTYKACSSKICSNFRRICPAVHYRRAFPVILVERFRCSCANQPIKVSSGSISESATSSIDISSILYVQWYWTGAALTSSQYW